MEPYSKPMAAAALIQNDAGALLIVKPNYREGWLLPGGMVEFNESPKQACRREINEEVGLELQVGRLLCVDYQSMDYQNNDRHGVESLKFLFDGGVVTRAQTASIVLQEDELNAHTFVSPAEALRKLSRALSRRTRHALTAQQTGQTFYLENQALS